MTILKLFLDKCEIEFFLLGTMAILPALDSLLEGTGLLDILFRLVFILICLAFIYKVAICKSFKWACGALGFYSIVVIPIGLFEYFSVQFNNDTNVRAIYNILSLIFVDAVLLRTCFRLENPKKIGGD